MTPKDTNLVADLQDMDLHERGCALNDEMPFPCDCGARVALSRLLELIKAQDAALRLAEVALAEFGACPEAECAEPNYLKALWTVRCVLGRMETP